MLTKNKNGRNDVQEQMRLLKELQDLDQELNGIGQRRRKQEDERSALCAEQERVQGMVDSLTGDLEALQAQRREIAQALALEQENVKKAEGRLPSIKTQKEYVAVLKEIDTAKKMNKEFSDRIQDKDAEIATLTREKEEKEGELAEVSSRVGGRRAQIDINLAEFDSTLGDKGVQRDKLLQQLPVPMRKRYQLLMERRAGLAVVEARSGACQGCHMHLPPQMYNRLFTTDEVQSCPHCARLLFVNHDD
jgi:uncharacterized protein